MKSGEARAAAQLLELPTRAANGALARPAVAPLFMRAFCRTLIDFSSNAAYRRRPVDLLVMPDGSLLVSDDEAWAIYRITYQP